jgi:archaellum biogenesis ATPase FlaH
LKDIEEWIDDVNAPNLFWLHGHPGTGKSAIATTIRDSLQSAGHLASSFFFRREDFTMQRPESLWCSVIYDLAQKYSAVRCLAVDQVNQQKIHPEDSHNTIIDQLVVVLGVDIQTDPKLRPVVVIDALDECGGQQQDKSYRKNLLSALSKWQSLATQVKIIVTSRDESDIRLAHGRGGLSSRILEVGRRVSDNSTRDIHSYLRSNFNGIRLLCKIKEPWPTDLQLQTLTDTAAGLFIWASTVIKLVEDGPPTEELNHVLKMSTTGWTSGTDTLTQLYHNMLVAKFTKPSQISLFIDVTGTIIVAKKTLTLGDLCTLFPSLVPDDVQ